MRRLHRPGVAVAESHARPQARERGRRPRRDDAARHRRHARPADVDRLRPPPQPLARDRRPPRQGHRGPRDLPARDRPTARPPRPPGHRRRRRPHGARRVRQPPVRRGVHRAGRGRGDDVRPLDRRDRPHPRAPGEAHRRERAPDGRDRPRGRAAPGHPREHGDAGTNLAELGVGTNDRATLTGNVLEDEKILGSVHVAFGASIAIGGTVSVPIHLDCVVTEASLEIDGTRVLDEGRFVLAA